MRVVVCIIGGAVLCGSFFVTLRLIEPEAPPKAAPEVGAFQAAYSDWKTSGYHYNDLPTATQNAGLARIDEILAQRPPTRTPKDSEAERQRFRAEAQSGHKILAKKRHPDKGGSTQQMDALLRRITKDD
jgi:hypothetical protein